MMDSTLSSALRDLFKQYSLAQRPIKFMAGEWITKNRRAEAAVNQIYVDLQEIPVIVLESEVEESFLNINIGFWNNDFDDARFETVVRKLRWQDAIYEISQRLLSQWQEEGRETTVTTQNGKQTHPDLIRRNREEFTHYMEVLHCIHVGMVADEYFLLYAPQRQLPLLPTLLPDLLEEVNLPEEERTALIHVVIDYANARFDGLAKIEPATIVDVRLAWAKILQELSDRYTFADQVRSAMAAWLQQRGITNSTEPIKDISSVLIPEDASFVQVVNPLLASLELPALNIAVSCFQRGLSHLEQSQWQLARLDFERTISLNPHADAYFQRGYAYLKLEDYASSIKDFDQAAMLQAQRAEIYEYRGHAYLGLKNYEVALANYNQAIHLGSSTTITNRDKLQNWLNNEIKRQREERRQALIIKLPNTTDSLELVWIPAGNLNMESGNEITLTEFRMSKYPITQAQYQAILGTNPSNFKNEPNSLNHPVDNVSWSNAATFCNKLSELTGEIVRLPSETEWEYACRAGSKGKYFFGENDSELVEYAWFNSNSVSKTHPVGDKTPNEFDLYDMYGNIWEWCSDNWTDNPNELPKDGSPLANSGNSSYHPLRGGAWNSNIDQCRSAHRYKYSDSTNAAWGFRVVVFFKNKKEWIV
jgi:formylglycine-generating enzyme required for sulfatase activity